MFPFMQTALDDAWGKAKNYEDFKTNIFRFPVPSDPEESYYKLYYVSTFEPVSYTHLTLPTNREV